ncbi:MAG: hypothetical protein R3B47_19155 [Bacteroidia bacterium]
MVNVKPRPVVDAGPDRIVCPRDSVPLLGKAWDAPLPYTHVWTPATGVNLPNSPTPNVSPPHTFTYFLVAFADGCPSEADSVTVQVRTMPTADAGNHFEICEGDTLRMGAASRGDRGTATLYRLGCPTLRATAPWYILWFFLKGYSIQRDRYVQPRLQSLPMVNLRLAPKTQEA